jgi:hypothetical protein
VRISRAELENLYLVVLALWEKLERKYERMIKDWLDSIGNDLYGIIDATQFMNILAMIAELESNDEYWKVKEEELKEATSEIFAIAIPATLDVIEPLVKPEPEEEPIVRPDEPAAPPIPIVVPPPAPGGREVIVPPLEKLKPDINNRLREIKGITDSVRQDVLNALKKPNIEEGDIKAIIKSGLDISEGRAGTIARTEIAGITADAEIMALQEAGVTHITWFSMGDGKVRPSHQIDGQTVELGSPFSNGLLYPHDPAGPVEEVVNCRCWFIPAQEE